MKRHHQKIGIDQDPQRVQTGAQKLTVVYIVVLFECLILAMFMGGRNEDDYEEATFVQMLLMEVIMAVYCAILCEPAMGVMNALFDTSQQV